MATMMFATCFILLLCVGHVFMQSTTTKPCKDDTRYNCWNYDDSKCQGIYEPWSRKHCPFRCGYCNEVPPCVDVITNCDEYGDDMCRKVLFGAFARENCRKYCSLCSYPGQKSTLAPPTSPGVTQVKTTIVPSVGHTHKPTPFPNLPTGAACQDSVHNCHEYSTESCHGVFKLWAMQHCARTCGYCTNEAENCQDYEQCDSLPQDLCTNSAYRTLAQTSCRKTCGFCTVAATIPAPTKMPLSTKIQASTTPAPQPPTFPANYTDQGPVAYAGGQDIVIYWPDTTAIINATQSTDDMGIVSYLWEYNGNRSTDIRGYRTDILRLYGLEVGVYNFKLTVTDGSGQTDSTFINVIVARTNDTCELDGETGVCFASILRYFYNSTSKACEQFIYGGCFGNSNNFETIESCQDYCIGTQVVEPTKMAVKQCSKNFIIDVPACCGPVCACNDTVQGIATDASNNASVMSNASVYVSGCHCHAFALTDDSGRYKIQGLCMEGTTLRFESEGYRSYLTDPIPNGDSMFTANAAMEINDGKNVMTGMPGKPEVGAVPTKMKPSINNAFG